MDSLAPLADPKVPDQMQKRKEKKRWDHLIKWSVRFTVLILLLLVGFLIKIVYDNRDLPDLVEAQRNQFIECQDENSNTPGCEKPVVTKKEVEEAKEGKAGLPGIPGDDGVQGIQGPPGPAPSTSQLMNQIMQALNAIIPTGRLTGPAGERGEAGTSTNGKDGESITGPQGPPGPQGEAGPKGDTGDRGPAGTDGSTGQNGEDGAPAPTVTGIVCDGSTGIFTFSNGSNISVADMCQGPLIPVPGTGGE
jgi:hypothetical protein